MALKGHRNLLFILYCHWMTVAGQSTTTISTPTTTTQEIFPWMISATRHPGGPTIPLCGDENSRGCLLGGPTAMSWESAHEFCRSQDGYLLAKNEQLENVNHYWPLHNQTIQSDEENNSIFRLRNLSANDLTWTALASLNGHYQWLSQFPDSSTVVGQFVTWSSTPEKWSHQCAGLHLLTQRIQLFSCSQALYFFCILPETPVWQADETEMNDVELRVTANMDVHEGWVEIPEGEFPKLAIKCSAFHRRSGQPLKVQPPVFWSKDGVYIDFHVHTLLPSRVHDSTKSHVPDIWSEKSHEQLKQGTFWCESWLPNSSSRLVSNKLLVTLKEWLVLILVAKRHESFKDTSDDIISKMRDTFRPSLLNIDNYLIDLISTQRDSLRNNKTVLTTYRLQVHIPMTENSLDYVLDIFRNNSQGYKTLYQNSGFLSTSSASLGTYCSEHREKYHYGNEIEWPFTRAGKVHPKNYKCREANNKLLPGYCKGNYTHGAILDFDPSNCEKFDSCPMGYISIADHFCVSVLMPDTWENGLRNLYKTGDELSILDTPEFFQVNNQNSVYEIIKEFSKLNMEGFDIWLPVRRIVPNGPLEYMGPGQMTFPYTDNNQSDISNISWANHHPVSNHKCLSLNLKTIKLSTHDCDMSIPYISLLNVSGFEKIPTPNWKSFLPQLITENPLCPRGWLSTGLYAERNYCFKLFLNVGNSTWKGAQEFCKQREAHLPSPGKGFLDWVYRQYIYDQNVVSVWMAEGDPDEKVQTMDFVNWKASTDYTLQYTSFSTDGWKKETEGTVKVNILCQKEVKLKDKPKMNLYEISKNKKKKKSKLLRYRLDRRSNTICLDLINISEDFSKDIKCYINGKSRPIIQASDSACLYNIESSQGYYECYLWTKHPPQLVRSNVLLNQDSNTLTFAVTLFQDDEYHPINHDSTFIYGKSQSDYTTDCVTSFLSYLQSKISNMQISSNNFFYSPGLKDDKLLHNYNMEITSKSDLDTLSSEYDMSVQLSNLFTQEQNFSGCTLVNIQSTIGCFGEVTKVYGLSEKNLSWPTVQGKKVVLPKELCITDEGEPVTRECKGNFLNGYQWGKISNGCTGEPSNLTRSLWNIGQSGNSKPNTDLKMISSLTADGSVLNPADIHFVATRLQSLSRKEDFSGMGLEEIVETLNNVMEADGLALESVQKKLNTSGILFEAFENITFNIKLPPANGDQILNASRKLISVERLDLEINSSVIGYQSGDGGRKQVTLNKGFQEDSIKGDAAIIFPENLTYIVATDSGKLAKIQSNSEKPKIKLTFAVYRNPKLFQDHKSFPNHSVGGDIIQASYDGKIVKNLKNPITLLFKHSAVGDDSKCVYWDFEKNRGLGGWSTEGCWKGERRGTYDVCLCNHLTCFAQLMNYNDEGYDGINAIALDIITIIGCSLSIIGLLMVFTTFFLFKKWRRSLSNKILVNLSFSVFCSIVIFLAGINQTWNVILCRSVAVSLHYFILASFGWMLVEAVHQYLKFVKVVGTYIPRFLWKASVSAWGVPLVPIIVVLVYDSSLYDSKLDEDSEAKICWMSSEGFMYAFLPPLVLTMLVNLIMFSLIIHGAICGRARVNSTMSERSLFMSQMSMAVCVFFLLGFTWIFGILSIWKGRLLFSYLFCIFNTLQGFFIFLFHVCRERTARRFWREFLSVVTKMPVSTSDPVNSNNINSKQYRGHLDSVTYNQGGGILVLPRRGSADTRRGSADTRRGSADTRRSSVNTHRGSVDTRRGSACTLRSNNTISTIANSRASFRP